MRSIVLLFALLLGAILISCSSSSENESVNGENLIDAAFSIGVPGDGIYAVDLDELSWQPQELEAGNIIQYKLTQAGNTIPYYQDGNLLFFYGIGPDSRYADESKYVLERGIPGKLMESKALVGESLTTLTEIWHKKHYEQNQIYDGKAAGALLGERPLREPWFWKTIQVSSGVDLDFDMPEIPINQARVRLALWGVTENPQLEYDHHLQVLINKVDIGEIQWDGQEYYTATIDFEPGVLQPGTNILSLNNQDSGSAAIDISRVDWFDIEYFSAPVPENDRLLLSGVPGKIMLTGFTGKPSVYDTTDRHNPVHLTGWDYMDDILTLSISEAQDLLVVGPEGYLKPNTIEPVIKSDLRSEDIQADMLIITDERFLEPLMPLVEARQNQSLNVRLVTLEEVYGTFGAGQDEPDSIREFIGYTLSHWAEPDPRYLLLVGDASYDYRGYLGDSIEYVIPAPMVPVLYSGETVSDNSLVDIDGDGKPEIAVGRWPVTSPVQVATLVSRTLAYEQGQAAEQAIFVADGSSPEFTNLNQSVLDESGFSLGEVNTTKGGDIEDLFQAWNAGAWLVNYAGHGSLDRWGKEGLLVNDQINELTAAPTSPPIVVQLTCLTGYFAHPSIQSLSETLLLNENGPVLVIGASSLTLSEYQQPFGANLLNQLNDVEVHRIGDAFLRAKSDLDLFANPNLKEVSDTFGLFGDPATIIIRPGQG